MTDSGGLADLILTGGEVITVDPEFRIAQAVAIVGDRIAAVGSADEVAAVSGLDTRTIDLAGRTAIPGLIDGHAHMDREGLKTVFPSLAGASSIQDVQDRIAALVENASPGEWIVTMPVGEPPNYHGVPEKLKEGRYPTRWELDEVSPDNPVFIRPIWGYWRHEWPVVSVANSRALAAGGIDRDTEPASDLIEFDKDPATGELTGVIREDTPNPIVELTYFSGMPGFTHNIRVAGLKESMRIYNSTATTSVFEGHGAADEIIDAYLAVEAAGAATVRARLVASPSWSGVAEDEIEPTLAEFAARFGGTGRGSHWLSFDGIHAALGPRPADALRAQAKPYTGWSGFNYDFGLPAEGTTDYLIAAARHELRIASIGLELLEHFEAVNEVVPIADKRWVLAHVARATPDQIERLKRLGIVLTIHANEHIHGANADETDAHVPLQSMIEAGLHFALSTDNVPPSMFNPIWLAVTRRCRAGGVVAPAQKISREAALRAATIEGAYLTFEEDQKGSIEPGKLADMAVLSDSPMTCPEDALKDITVDLTIVGGRVVYDRTG